MQVVDLIEFIGDHLVSPTFGSTFCSCWEAKRRGGRGPPDKVESSAAIYLRSSTKLFADETTAPVLDQGRGRTKTGQLWAYARDDSPWGGSNPPAVAYVYEVDDLLPWVYPKSEPLGDAA
jgi:hypothetical protein